MVVNGSTIACANLACQLELTSPCHGCTCITQLPDSIIKQWWQKSPCELVKYHLWEFAGPQGAIMIKAISTGLSDILASVSGEPAPSSTISALFSPQIAQKFSKIISKLAKQFPTALL